MRSQKSDDEGFQSSKTKSMVRATKPKAVKKEHRESTDQSVGQKKHATFQSQPEHALSSSEGEVQTRIAKRAYELYEKRGWQHGYDVADWLQAAREIGSKTVR